MLARPQVVESIRQNKLSWDALFLTPPFFDDYKHYLMAVATAGSPEEHLEW